MYQSEKRYVPMKKKAYANCQKDIGQYSECNKEKNVERSTMLFG